MRRMSLVALCLSIALAGCESKVDRYIRLKQLSKDMHDRAELAGVMLHNLDAEMATRGVQTDLIAKKDSISKSFTSAFSDSLQHIDAELALMTGGKP